MEEVISYIDFTEAHCRWAPDQESRSAHAGREARDEIEAYLRQRLLYKKHRDAYDKLRKSGKNGNKVREEMSEHCHWALVRGFLLPEKEVTWKNSVISFNYDLIMDITFANNEPIRIEEERRFDIEYNYRLKQLHNLLNADQYVYSPYPNSYEAYRQKRFSNECASERGLYLKLHGSLDWFYCPNPQCPHHRRAISEFDEYADQSWFERMCAMCSASLRMAIVPPTFTKDYNDIPTLALQWRLAVRELQRAEQVIIIGLSIAPSDSRLRWLLQYGLRRSEGHVDIDYVHYRDREAACRLKHLLPSGAQRSLLVFDNGMKDYVESGRIPTEHERADDDA